MDFDTLPAVVLPADADPMAFETRLNAPSAPEDVPTLLGVALVPHGPLYGPLAGSGEPDPDPDGEDLDQDDLAGGDEYGPTGAEDAVLEVDQDADADLEDAAPQPMKAHDIRAALCGIYRLRRQYLYLDRARTEARMEGGIDPPLSLQRRLERITRQLEWSVGRAGDIYRNALRRGVDLLDLHKQRHP